MLITLGVILFVAAFVCSALLSRILRGVARRVGFVDRPGARKIHLEPVALGGGVALFATTTAIAVGGVAFALLQNRTGFISGLPRVLQDHIPLIVDRAPLALYVFAGGAVMFALGLLDDAFQLSPVIRLAVQVGVAATLYAVSEELRLTAFAGSATLSFFYTVFWVVGITNAFNLLDNMDGLSAGVALIASFAFLVVAVMTQQYFLAAVLLVFAGSLVGFLLLNFPPASLFMGDAGSMFVGYMLGVLTILFTFYTPGRGLNPVSALLTPLVILAVPLYDTISVVIIRLAAGKSIVSGDKNHFSHRLVTLGMTRRAAVMTIYLVTLCTGLLAPLLMRVSPGLSLLVFANVAVMLVLVWLLEHAGRRGRTQQEDGH